MDDLPVQMFHQRPIFRFGVADDDVVVGGQEHVGDLPLRRERLAGAGGPEDQTVGVFQEQSVHHDEVVGEGVDAAVEGPFAVLEQLLCSEGHKNSDA